MNLLYLILLAMITSLAMPPGATALENTFLSQVENQIKKDRIFAKALSFRVDQFNGEIIVSTYRHPLANKKDLKIDALLISHSILKVSLHPINSVKVYYFNKDDNSKYWLAIVPSKLLTQLKKNRFNKDSAINQVKLAQSKIPNPILKLNSSSYNEITQANIVSDGYLAQERKQLLLRIKALKAKGVDVSNLEKVFFKMDDLVRAGDRQIKPLYLYSLTLLEAKEKKRISTLELMDL